MTNIIRLLAVGAATLIATAAGALGANISLTGNFLSDDQVFTSGFTVTDPSTVTLRTLSYSSGGFDPVLSLFGTAGNLLTFNDDSDTSIGNFDASIQTELVAGAYTVAVTQATSFPIGPNLSSGFTTSGARSFNGLSSAFAVDILIVPTVSPEQPPRPGVPDSGSSFALFVLSFGGLVGLRRFVNRG